MAPSHVVSSCWSSNRDDSASRESITEGELLTLIDIGEAEGTFEAAEAEMLENVFRFGDRQVREVMTPRNEIVSIKRGASLQQFLNMYAENSHTRLFTPRIFTVSIPSRSTSQLNVVPLKRT